MFQNLLEQSTKINDEIKEISNNSSNILGNFETLRYRKKNLENLLNTVNFYKFIEFLNDFIEYFHA